MFKMQVPQEIIDYCTQQTEQHNFGQRSTANGTKEQQRTGLIGQSMVMALFGAGQVSGEDGCDGGLDVLYAGRRIDVKTMGRTTSVQPHYTNNFLALQAAYKTDAYVFCSYNKNNCELTVCGWVTKDELAARRRFYPKGTIRQRSDGTTFETFADLYEIDNCNLHDVGTPYDLLYQLKSCG